MRMIDIINRMSFLLLKATESRSGTARLLEVKDGNPKCHLLAMSTIIVI